jgi:hypothetical protein
MEPVYGEVVVYEHDAWSGYLIPAIVPGANRIGVRLGECSKDVLSRLPACCRLFVFHINLTFSARVPFGRESLVAELQARDIAVCNAGLVDISKRRVQQICARVGLASIAARPDGDPDEFLLVKTTYNFHGASECKLSVEQRRMLGYESPHDMPPRRETDYRIVRRSEVPPAVWTSPHWVVERYVTNSDHRFHRVYVAGDALVVSRVFDSSPFKKMPEGIERESHWTRLSDVHRPSSAPSDIQRVATMSARIAKVANVDYGAFDIVSDDDGEIYLIDINVTPHWGDGGHPDLLAYLGAGLVASRHGK